MTTEAPRTPTLTPAPVARAGALLLDQCAALIREVSDDAYVTDSAVLTGGTIGKHVRHSLDHYAAALHAANNGALVDYDRRERGGHVETSRDAALDAIQSVRDALALVSSARTDESLSVRCMLDAEGCEATFGSTLGREIAFAGHHAVHHFAMIKAIASEHGASVGDSFGKAPSTLNHESRRRNG